MKSILLVKGKDNLLDTESIEKRFSDYLASFGEVSVVKTGTLPFHVIFSKIKDSRPDAIVSINDAALDFVTEGGRCSLNQIPSKVIHFLCSKDYYSRFDGEMILNLSHIVSVFETDTVSFSDSHINIPNVCGHSEDAKEFCSGLEKALKELWCI